MSAVEQLLEPITRSHVTAARLPCCVETDWASARSLSRLGAVFPVVAQLQVAAGFVAVRKTDEGLKFVEDWLRACEDSEVLQAGGEPEFATFVRHMFDQVAFSVLFKRRGFESFPWPDLEGVVNVSRWLE